MRMLNRLSRSRSAVGRIACDPGAASLRPRNLPPTIRISAACGERGGGVHGGSPAAKAPARRYARPRMGPQGARGPAEAGVKPALHASCPYAARARGPADQNRWCSQILRGRRLWIPGVRALPAAPTDAAAQVVRSPHDGEWAPKSLPLRSLRPARPIAPASAWS